MTKVVVTAGTVVAYSALHTDVSVGAVFAVFAAVGTDVGTFRAALTAGTNHIHTVFAILALRAVVTVATYAIKANPAT